MNPGVSTIIPTYNRPNLLTNAVNSVLTQTLPVAEIIIIDDGSTEDVQGEVQRNLAENSAWRGRVQYFYQENQGQSVALNHGIARAKHEWFSVVASDDLWLPWKLEWQFRAIEKYQDRCGLCFTDAWFMKNRPMKGMTAFSCAKDELPGEIGIVEDPVRLLLQRQPVWVQTILARTDLLRQVGGFDPQLRYAEDTDFVFRMGLKTKFCYVGIPLVLIDRSPSMARHEGPSKAWAKESFRLEMDDRRMASQLKSCKELAPELQMMARENMRSHYSKWASFYLKIGEYSRAKGALSTAVKYKFTPGMAFKWVLVHLAPKVGSNVIRYCERKRDNLSTW